MNNYIKFICLLTFALLISSCEKSLEELNVDPNNPTEVSLNLLLPELQTQSAFNEGTNPNRVAGIVVQQLIGLDAQQLGYNGYILNSSTMNNFWNTGLFSGTLRSANLLMNTSDERPFYASVAKIYMANELGKATSMFGDMPYTEAFQGTDNLKPSYDSQEAIYGTIQRLLDEAISEFSAGSAGYFGGDLVFGGVQSSWIQTAQGLKARYYLQTSKRNPGDMNLAANAAAQSFQSNADAGGFQFEISETANWALAKFGIERPSTLGVNTAFAESLNGDPRQPVLTSFDGTQWTFFDGAEGGLIWGRSDAKVPIISYVELLFIQAEAAAANGGDASGLLKQAIEASFELSGVVDMVGYADDKSADGSVANVVTEAYKAYFGFNFHESWANWRRTGFPSLTPSPVCSDNGFNPSCAVPQRYLYAESEKQTNSANVDAAISAQGGELLDVSLWAFRD